MNDLTKFGISSGLGGLGAGLGSMMMGGGNNPYDAAKGSFDQIPGTISPYFNPYIEAGRSALPQLQNQYGSMMGNYQGVQNQYNSLMNDPSAKYNQLASGYQRSPGYNWNMSQGMAAADNAAAAGGMQGSPQHQQQASTIATGLASQDFQNYLSHVLGLYGSGLQGNQNMFTGGLQGMQGINNQGYNASDTLAGALSSNLMNQGNLAFSGAAAQNQAQGTQMGDVMGGLGTLAMFL